MKSKNMNTVTIEQKQFAAMLTKLDRVTDMLALNIVRDCETQKDKILILSSLGYGVTEIAKLLKTTVGTANQALVRARKDKKAKDAKSESQQEEVNVETIEGDATT